MFDITLSLMCVEWPEMCRDTTYHERLGTLFELINQGKTSEALAALDAIGIAGYIAKARPIVIGSSQYSRIRDEHLAEMERNAARWFPRRRVMFKRLQRWMELSTAEQRTIQAWV